MFLVMIPVGKFNVAVKNHHFDRDDFSINGPFSIAKLLNYQRDPSVLAPGAWIHGLLKPPVVRHCVLNLDDDTIAVCWHLWRDLTVDSVDVLSFPVWSSMD